MRKFKGSFPDIVLIGAVIVLFGLLFMTLVNLVGKNQLRTSKTLYKISTVQFPDSEIVKCVEPELFLP